MSLEILERTDRNLKFVVEGISIEMANAIRRIIISEIPVMAVDEVIILKNDSPLYDEIIAHRLSMIPLTTDLDVYKLPRECSCEGYGCPLCQVSLTCEVTNTSNNPMELYSGDLNSNDPKIIPVNPNIPIVKIDKNDKVIIEAYAVLGVAKDHVKWQAVSNIFYRFYPQIDFDDSKCAKCLEKCVVSRLCPEKLYDFSNKKTPRLMDEYWKTCTLCNSCRNDCPEEAIKVGWKDDTYIFSIESDGVLEFDVVLKKTFEVFLEKIDEFVEKLEEAEIEL
ncbi:MAG: DNA-directed RNA polymerase subunit D [Candidatus Lokiarchaeota archaeon]|nr:DNA-directed RNA polymerase subunit D [Candidatus Lokiarchaeota archaeon]MCK4479573.1 DNA-directed RNA polymerase subunit D [Candidatus Lokiarchaeota archaeon]